MAAAVSLKSTLSAKEEYFLSVMIPSALSAPPALIILRIPSSTRQQSGALSRLNPLHPDKLFPSKRRLQPASFSVVVRLFNGASESSSAIREAESFLSVLLQEKKTEAQIISTKGRIIRFIYMSLSFDYKIRKRSISFQDTSCMLHVARYKILRF